MISQFLTLLDIFCNYGLLERRTDYFTKNQPVQKFHKSCYLYRKSPSNLHASVVLPAVLDAWLSEYSFEWITGIRWLAHNEPLRVRTRQVMRGRRSHNGFPILRHKDAVLGAWPTQVRYMWQWNRGLWDRWVRISSFRVDAGKKSALCQTLRQWEAALCALIFRWDHF